MLYVIVGREETARMNGILEAARQKQHRLALIAIVVASISAALFVANQSVAALLVPLVAALAVEIVWRDARARVLAQQITTGQPSEKLEVPRGAWGDLSRAINSMVQQRRVQQRLQSAAPAGLPDAAVQAILSGELYGAHEPRMVSVLLLSAGRQRADDRARRTAIQAWQKLAASAHAHAQQHGALLQPYGDALMLVFGAFSEQGAAVTARAALSVGAALQGAWRAHTDGREGALVLSIATGPAWITMLPKLGCSVIGAPVQQASRIMQLAHEAHYDGPLCNEEMFYALRSRSRANWQPTSLRLHAQNRSPQPVYCWREAA
jgi:class 3 adenylate cyclase